MIKRPDMLDDRSAGGIEIIQLTDEEIPSSHVYMEAQIFTPDSKRFILNRDAHPHGPNKESSDHKYMLCDIENNCELRPITEELMTNAPSIAPGRSCLYYIIDESQPGSGRVTLKKVNLDGMDRETICVLDSGVPGDGRFPSRVYPLSTISSDGQHLATGVFLGNGTEEQAPFGLLVFDLTNGEAWIAIEGETFCNLHPQYSRDPNAPRDVMIQENHGNEHDQQGDFTRLTGGAGADIHVIRDDGTDVRTFPWGRDDNEFCQGHQCWRGRSDSGITSTSTRDVGEEQLIESPAVDIDSHEGLNIHGGQRNDLSRDFQGPHFYHFATDISGERFITDCGSADEGMDLYYAHLPQQASAPIPEFIYLCNSGHKVDKNTHVHPFLSPDGSLGFFNSAESGILQAYMITGLGGL